VNRSLRSGTCIIAGLPPRCGLAGVDCAFNFVDNRCFAPTFFSHQPEASSLRCGAAVADSRRNPLKIPSLGCLIQRQPRYALYYLEPSYSTRKGRNKRIWGPLKPGMRLYPIEVSWLLQLPTGRGNLRAETAQLIKASNRAGGSLSAARAACPVRCHSVVVRRRRLIRRTAPRCSLVPAVSECV
jgi:hypothetical protein